MNNALGFLSIAEAGRRIKNGDLSPLDLTRAMLERIKAIDGKLDSYLLITEELAIEQARIAEAEISKGQYRGPMHGIPYALKDNIETKGIRTTAHSRILIDNLPDRDATVVSRLADGGAILLGKLACLEFTHGTPSSDQAWPQARNPWNVAHGFTGGSSTGSASAVAAGLAMGALGTDTGGSVRNPSAFCGLAGLMPTYGRISRAGIIPYAFTLDHCGPMCRTVEDCALMLQVVAGFDPADPGSADTPVPDFSAGLSRDIKGLRIGYLRNFHDRALEPGDEMRLALEAAAAQFESLGAIVGDADIGNLEDFNDVKNIIAEAEFCAVHEKDYLERISVYGNNLQFKAAPGLLIRAVDYIQAQRKRAKLIHNLCRVMKNFDVLLTVTVFEPSPEIDPAGKGRRAIQLPNCTQPFNVTGSPSISICNGFSRGGLPLAMQVIGRHFDEATVLRVAHAYETSTPWRDTHPEI